MTQKPQQRRGLGRGLGSLIPTAPRPEVEPGSETVPADGSPRVDGTSVPVAGAPGDGAGRAVDWIGAPATESATGASETAPAPEPEDDGSLRPVAGAYF